MTDHSGLVQSEGQVLCVVSRRLAVGCRGGWSVLLLTKLALSDESCPILCSHHSRGLTEAVNAKCSLLSALCFIFFYLHGVASSVLNQIPF